MVSNILPAQLHVFSNLIGKHITNVLARPVQRLLIRSILPPPMAGLLSWVEVKYKESYGLLFHENCTTLLYAQSLHFGVVDNVLV